MAKTDRSHTHYFWRDILRAFVKYRRATPGVIYYLFLAGSVIFTALGQLFYKMFWRERTITFFLLTVGSFVLVPFLNYMALIKIPLDIVYMFMSNNIVLVLLLSVAVLGERMYLKQYIGAAIIVLGIVVYTL